MFSHNPFTIGFVGGNHVQPAADFKRTPDKNDIHHRFRIFVTGDKEAGKTALIVRMCETSYQRSKYTLNSGYSMCRFQIAKEVVYFRVNDFDTREYKQHQHEREKEPFDSDVAFIVVKLKKKRTPEELELAIQKYCQEIRSYAPQCQVVLIASKSDKADFKTSAESLKSIALKLKCLGAAVVNDSVENVQQLFRATAECLVAEKKARLAPPAAPAQATTSLGASLSFASAPPLLFSHPASAPLSAFQQEAITEIQKYIDTLVEELCSFFAMNRRRKLVKIEAMRELIACIQRSPGTELQTHIDAIKQRYAGNELEVGTRTQEVFRTLLQGAERDATRRPV